MTASSNFGNVFSVLVAAGWLPFLPMLPIHLLLQNLFYDFSQIAIPWDNMDESFLRNPHGWDPKSIAWFMLIIGPTSSVFDMTTFCFSWFYMGWQTPAQQTPFQSCWFVEGLITQTLIVHMIRTEKIPFLQSTAAPIVCCTTVACCILGLLCPNIPGLNSGLDMSTNPWQFFVYLPFVVICYFILTNFVKKFYIRVFGYLL